MANFCLFRRLCFFVPAHYLGHFLTTSSLALLKASCNKTYDFLRIIQSKNLMTSTFEFESDITSLMSTKFAKMTDSIRSTASLYEPNM